jgi:hypothetical protein
MINATKFLEIEIMIMLEYVMYNAMCHYNTLRNQVYLFVLIMIDA